MKNIQHTNYPVSTPPSQTSLSDLLDISLTHNHKPTNPETIPTPPQYHIPTLTTLHPSSCRTPGQLNTKLPPLTTPTRTHNLLSNRLLQTLIIPSPILSLNLLQMPRLPMQPHQPGNQQLGALATSPRFANGLVEEEGVAHRAVDSAV